MFKISVSLVDSVIYHDFRYSFVDRRKSKIFLKVIQKNYRFKIKKNKNTPEAAKAANLLKSSI